jgi:hypothetical protein
VYKQTLRSVKLTTGKKGKKTTELTGKGPLRRRRSALDCSATEEEECLLISIIQVRFNQLSYLAINAIKLQFGK